MATQEAEDLVERIERLTDAAGPEAQELLGAVMELYGEGLARIVELAGEAGEPAAPLRRALVDDGVVASLLLIHDLYPIPLEERVAEALASVRPYMESHGGDVELVSIGEDGVAHLRLEGSCSGCPASAATLELAIEEALAEHAPDLAGLEVEGVVEREPRGPGAPVGLVLPMVQVPASPPPAPSPAWQPVGGVDELGGGELTAVAVGGAALVVARVGERLLAYHNRCPACEAAVSDGLLQDGVLTCPRCAAGYSLPMAGRAFDGGGASLEPVPLLEDPVRVALER